jgi:uncharacterized protein (DUF305 family)
LLLVSTYGKRCGHRGTFIPHLQYRLESGQITELAGAGRRFIEGSQRSRIKVSAILEGETMRFTWSDSKALILKSGKELITSFVAAAMVVAMGFAIGSTILASAQDPSRRSSAAEATFLKENDAAMTKMMNDMAVKPTGDVDHDFVAMMVPHHEGAIDMAEAELRYGQNEQLRRIAQEVVAEELQEIAAMRAASGEKLTPTEATLAASFAGTAAGPGFSPPGPADNVPPSLKRERLFLAENNAAMTKMMNDMTIKPTGNIDRDFVAMMVPHHQGAIEMAQAELRYGREAQLRRIAQEIVVDQIQQISLMRLAVGEPLPSSVSSPTNPTSPARHID